MRARFTLGLVFTLLIASSAAAASAWTESGDGDLSGDGQAPTPLVFSAGENTIQGTMGTPFLGDLDRDNFTITLAPGQQLTSIVVNSITPGQNSFFAIASGDEINLFDGGAHLSNFLIGEPGEYFSRLAAPEFGGTGHVGPLGAGTYTIWFQETQSHREYTATYTVVPEPAGLTPIALALLFLLMACRSAQPRGPFAQLVCARTI